MALNTQTSPLLIAYQTGLPLTTGERKRYAWLETHEEWHPSAACPICGEAVFWHAPFTAWLCRSWLYMEDGCTFKEGEKRLVNAPAPR